jgi:hypothetical protein
MYSELVNMGLADGWYTPLYADAEGVITGVGASGIDLVGMYISGYNGFKVEVEESTEASNGVVYFDMTDTGEKDATEHPIYSTSLSATEIIALYRRGAYVIGRCVLAGGTEKFEFLANLLGVHIIDTRELPMVSINGEPYLIEGNTAMWD